MKLKPTIAILFIVCALSSAFAQNTATPSPTATQAPPAPAVGTSVAIEQVKTTVVSGGWLAKIRQGGTTGFVQIGLSIFGASFALERFFHMRRKFIAPRGLTRRARELWKTGKFAELEALGESEPCTLARVISFIVKHRDEPIGEVSTMAGDIAAQELKMHSQRAYPLGVVATLEPLLGLLGMILGMIHTFEVVAISGALGDPTQLASGISEALVTTGLGLAVAIPFLAMYHYFKNKIAIFGADIEKETTGLLSDWFFGKGAGRAH